MKLMNLEFVKDSFKGAQVDPHCTVRLGDFGQKLSLQIIS